MKKPSITLLALGLAMIFVVDGCRKEEPFPLEPDSEIAAELAAITFTPITLVEPVPVTESPGDVQTSAAMIAFEAALDRITEESVPAEIQVLLDAVDATLSVAEIDKFDELTEEELDEIADGGALPADLQVIFDKLDANAVLQAALPIEIFPVVDGITISGGRTGVMETIEKNEGIEVEDQCIVAANAAFGTKKTELDNSKAEEVVKINAAFQTNTFSLASNEQTCIGKGKIKYNDKLLKGKLLFERNKISWKKNSRVRKKLRISIVYTSHKTSKAVTKSSLREERACRRTRDAKIKSATDAQNINMAAAEAEYQTKLRLAESKRVELIKSCHNQGSGK